MTVHIQIEKFEGPLALLLHLIRKEEMDIFDINVNAITKQYLEYIKKMKKLNLEVAGEFIAMAATLIQIKSRMLLPQYDDDGEVVESEDPRKELVQRLLEYQAFQEVSQRLYERPLLGRDLWVRGTRETIETDQEEEIITEENALFSLIVSYRKAIKNMKKAVHKVAADLQSIAERVNELRIHLVKGAKLKFFDLIDHKEPGEKRADQVLITFLSMLELAKVGIVGLFQSENFGEIHVEAKTNVEDDVLARVEDYESPNENNGAGEIAVTSEDLVDIESTGSEQMALGQSVGQTDGEASNESVEPGRFEDEIGGEIIGEDGSFQLDAATDEEILEEEKKLAAEDEVLDGDTDVISVASLMADIDDADEDVVENTVKKAAEENFVSTVDNTVEEAPESEIEPFQIAGMKSNGPNMDGEL